MRTKLTSDVARMYDGPDSLPVLVLLACQDADHSSMTRRRKYRRAVAVALLSDLERARAVMVTDAGLQVVNADALVARLASRSAPAVLHALSAPLPLPDAIAAVEGPATRVAWELLVGHGDARHRRRPGYELTNVSATRWWRQILATAPRNPGLQQSAVALWAILDEIGLLKSLCEDVAKHYRGMTPPGLVLPLLLPLHKPHHTAH